jgi:aldehyde:ferredoxin oxidoreductase
MGNGYYQKLLRVNLENRKSQVESIAEEDLKKFIGGAGLAAEILRRELPGKLSPYDPRNKIIFGAGPFQGPPIAGGAKFSIAAISPLTATFGDTAAGADWGPALKDAGYDVLVVEGVADKPVYLRIADHQMKIEDAAHLWGRDAYETIDTIRQETGDPRLSISAIGPAGEKKVAIACVIVDKHSFAGRCGLGAVMGAKNLKAIAIRGTQRAPLAQPDKAKDLMQKISRDILEEVKKNGFREHGTPNLCVTAEGLGDMPIKYWEGDVWPEGAKKLGAPNYTQVLKAEPYPCKFCPVGCHRKIMITEPREYVLDAVGPEYETLGMMGTNLFIDDPKAVAKANDLANRLGIDTISVGAMVGFAMECYEKGWITTQDTMGLELKWGDPKVLISLVEQIGRRSGFGAIFAEGTMGAAKKIGKGAEDIVAHCKGLDLPAHDARACISLAPTYATGTRGACHFRGGCEDVEMGGFFIPEIGVQQGGVKFFEPENQALLAVKCQDFFALLNSLVLCAFMPDGGAMSFTAIRDLFNAITGWNFSCEDLMAAGERIFTVQRLINIRDGYNAQTDVLPKKMYQPAQEGFRAGKVPPFKEMMEDYYRVRGWNEKGEPSEQTMEKVGLKK